jgi:hypothetical protein
VALLSALSTVGCSRTALDALDTLDSVATDAGPPPATVSCGVGECTRRVSYPEGTAPPECVPGSPSNEICNGLDDDCDGFVDEELLYAPVRPRRMLREDAPTTQCDGCPAATDGTLLWVRDTLLATWSTTRTRDTQASLSYRTFDATGAPLGALMHSKIGGPGGIFGRRLRFFERAAGGFAATLCIDAGAPAAYPYFVDLPDPLALEGTPVRLPAEQEGCFMAPALTWTPNGAVTAWTSNVGGNVGNVWYSSPVFQARLGKGDVVEDSATITPVGTMSPLDIAGDGARRTIAVVTRERVVELRHLDDTGTHLDTFFRIDSIDEPWIFDLRLVGDRYLLFGNSYQGGFAMSIAASGDLEWGPRLLSSKKTEAAVTEWPSGTLLHALANDHDPVSPRTRLSQYSVLGGEGIPVADFPPAGFENRIAVAAANGYLYVQTTVWDSDGADGRQDVFLDVLSCRAP